MSALDQVAARAVARGARVVAVGQGDGSVETAAALLAERGFGSVTVVGSGGLDPAADPRLGAVAKTLRELWPERVRDGIHALDLAANPLLFAAGLAARGDAEVCLAGTAVPLDTLEEAARWLTGSTRGSKGRGHVAYLATTDGRLVTLVVPDSAGPLDARIMANLALGAVAHRTRVQGDVPRIGFLVAPPSQDASHADAELVLAEFRSVAPGVSATVEWSWQAIADPEDPARFRSGPNVLIFPDPVSGHLAQLVLRDAAGLKAWGPLFPDERWVLAGAPESATPADLAAVAMVAAAGMPAA